MVDPQRIATEPDLSRLTDEEFEHLCFDILASLGPESIDWRKGTSGPGSPADQGRDIECTFRRVSPGGDAYSERWFVECKHYTKGVPAAAFEGALAAANANRPDVLHLMVSGFLSNPAKESLKTYVDRHRPSFRVVIWERPQIVEKLSRDARLVLKYGLTDEAPHLALLHPVHVRYLREVPLIDLEQLFEITDALHPEQRLEYFYQAMVLVVHPRMREPTSRTESLAELMLDQVTYPIFKERCEALPVSGLFLARAIVEFSLHSLFHSGDVSRTAEVQHTIQGLITHLETRHQQLGVDAAMRDDFLREERQMLASTPERLHAQYRRYVEFCERVLLPVLETPTRPVRIPDAFRKRVPES